MMMMYKVQDPHGGQNDVRAMNPARAAESYVDDLAKDGEIMHGDDITVTVTDPSGTNTRWFCTCFMTPHVRVEQEDT